MARSILFFDATVMAVMFSAAFLAMGRMINLMKASESGVSATMASIVSVRKKAEMETRAEAVRSMSEAGRLMLDEIEEGRVVR